jgi:hypothetical protein
MNTLIGIGEVLTSRTISHPDITIPSDTNFVRQLSKSRINHVYHQEGTMPLDRSHGLHVTAPANLHAELALMKQSGLGIVN